MQYKPILGQFLIILLIITANTGVAQRNEHKTEYCISQWDSLLKKNNGKHFKILLRDWQALESQCQGTGYYEFRLSTIYERSGDLKKAKHIIKKASRQKMENGYYLDFAALLYEFMDLVSAANRDKSAFEKIANGYKQLISKHPQFILAFEQLVNVQLYANNTSEALMYAKQTLKINPDSWTALRAFVLIYTEQKQYQQSRPLIVKAVKLNENLLADYDFMMASATTYINVGDYKTAESVLSLLLERSPDVKNDQQFIKTVKYLRKKLQNL